MQIPFEEIHTLRPSKCQDIYKVNFSNRVDFNKAKYILSRLNVRWTANEFTRTLYFCGKNLLKENEKI